MTELVPVHRVDNPLIEIIFVHGLDGDPIETWSFDQTQSWLQWIAGKYPRARIWSLQYRLRSSGWLGGSMPLTTRARNVLAVLDGEIADVPIVFVCHSYGGLLVKQLLRTAEEMRSQYSKFAAQVAGIVFLATPNTGSSVAGYVSALGKIVRSSTAIKELRRSSAILQDLNYWFRERAQLQKWLLRAYFETLPTYGVVVVVDESSADLGMDRPIPVDADHIQICKPEKPDFRVRHTLAMIEQILANKQLTEPTITPLGLLLSASDEQLPYHRARFEAALHKSPQDLRLRTALVHLDLLESQRPSPQVLASSFRISSGRALRFTAYAVLSIALTTLIAAYVSDHGSRLDRFAIAPPVHRR